MLGEAKTGVARCYQGPVGALQYRAETGYEAVSTRGFPLTRRFHPEWCVNRLRRHGRRLGSVRLEASLENPMQSSLTVLLRSAASRPRDRPLIIDAERISSSIQRTDTLYMAINGRVPDAVQAGKKRTFSHPECGAQLRHVTHSFRGRHVVDLPQLGMHGKSSTVNRVFRFLGAAAIFRYQTEYISLSNSHTTSTNRASVRKSWV